MRGVAVGGNVFGIIRPCRHRLGSELAAIWQAHLCGMCLALRDDHGQAARLVTNYDGVVVSVLAEAQSAAAPERRPAGRCVLRRMRRAEVAAGDCARLSAAVSLVLAAAKVRDHVADADGVAGRPGIRTAAGRLARRWARQGAETGGQLGLDAAVLADAIDRQASVEAAAGPGTALLAITEPTETATAAAFGHTAVLAGRPGNRAAVIEAGRLFGRVAHLLDAVQDLPADTASGAWNPLVATGTDVSEAHRLCLDALLGIRLALAEVDFTDARLVRLLLDDELRRSVRATFGHEACAHQSQAVSSHHPGHFSPCQAAAAGGQDDAPGAGAAGQPADEPEGSSPLSAQDAVPGPGTRRSRWETCRDSCDCDCSSCDCDCCSSCDCDCCNCCDCDCSC
jgi:hypothetical protein